MPIPAYRDPKHIFEARGSAGLWRDNPSDDYRGIAFDRMETAARQKCHGLGLDTRRISEVIYGGQQGYTVTAAAKYYCISGNIGSIIREQIEGENL